MYFVHDQQARALGFLVFFIFSAFALVDDLSAYIFALEIDPRLRSRFSSSAIIVGLKM